MSISKKILNNLLKTIKKSEVKTNNISSRISTFKYKDISLKVSPKVGPGMEEAQGGCDPTVL